jgi:hypothetical protein
MSCGAEVAGCVASFLAGGKVLVAGGMGIVPIAGGTVSFAVHPPSCTTRAAEIEGHPRIGPENYETAALPLRYVGADQQ